MKIKFLGTSAGWPLPRLGCRDKICTSIDPKDKRTRSQALVNDVLLIDIGPDTYWHLSKFDIDPGKIKYAAITHEHPDHTFGLWDLGHIYHSGKIKIIIHPTTFKKIRKLFFYKEYQVLPSEIGSRVRVDGLEISLLPVNHTNSSFGVYVEEPGAAKKLFYAPDLKSLPPATEAKIRGIDLVVWDGSELQIPTKNHQTIIEGTARGKKLAVGEIYFTHIGHRTLPHEGLENFVQEKGGHNFHSAYDGLEIQL